MAEREQPMTLIFAKRSSLRAEELIRTYLYDKKRLGTDDTVFLHSLRVAEPFTGVRRVVALLHDIVAASEVTLADIESIFTSRVARHVSTLTRRPNDSYFDYIRRIRLSKVSREVKIVDILDKLPDAPAALRKRYIKALRILHGLEA